MNITTLVAITIPQRDDCEYPPLWRSPSDRADFIEDVCEIVSARVLVRQADVLEYFPKPLLIANLLADRIDEWFMATNKGFGLPFEPETPATLAII